MLPPFVNTIVESYVRKLHGPETTIGRPRATTYSTIIDMIFYVLRSGCQWRLLPTKGLVSWQTVHRYFRFWSRKGIFEKTYKHLLGFYLMHSGKNKSFMITDCSFVKNICGIDCTGPSAVDRGRKANKISVIVDETGIPWGITFHKGNKHDAKAFCHTTQEIKKLKPITCITRKTFLGDRALTK